MTSYVSGAYSLGLWGTLYPTHFIHLSSANSLTTLCAPQAPFLLPFRLGIVPTRPYSVPPFPAFAYSSPWPECHSLPLPISTPPLRPNSNTLALPTFPRGHQFSLVHKAFCIPPFPCMSPSDPGQRINSPPSHMLFPALRASAHISLWCPLLYLDIQLKQAPSAGSPSLLSHSSSHLK